MPGLCFAALSFPVLIGAGFKIGINLSARQGNQSRINVLSDRGAEIGRCFGAAPCDYQGAFSRYRRSCVAAAQVVVASANILINIDKSAADDRNGRWRGAPCMGGFGLTLATPRHRARTTSFRLEKDHHSKEWDDAPMPHSIFFTSKGHAIHGSYEIFRRLGRPASHDACARARKRRQALCPCEPHGLGDTKVVLTGGRPALARPSPPPRTPSNVSAICTPMPDNLVPCPVSAGIAERRRFQVGIGGRVVRTPRR